MGSWSNSNEGRRRSQRVILSIPITVSGETEKGAFTEQTQTLVINAHGALVALAARIGMGQKLQVKCATSPQPQDCSVVYVGPTVEGRTQFGIEFTAANPYFWQIAFPPEDWTMTSLDDQAQPTSPAAGAEQPAAQKSLKK